MEPIKGRYSQREKPRSRPARAFASRTRRRTPEITISETIQVAPKYSDVSTMDLVSSSRKPAPKAPKCSSSRLDPRGLNRSTATTEIVSKLNEEINRAMRQPDVSEKMVNAGLIIVTEPPEHFGRILKTDYEKYGSLVRSIGFTPQ